MAEAKTVAALNAEITEINAELQQIAEREREAEHGIGELSLQARRGDKRAAAKLDKYDQFCAEAMATRRRLKAARSGVEEELQIALALERSEATKEMAREAKEVIQIFRTRGAAIDAGLQAVIDNYFGLRVDAAALNNLGVKSINAELVRVNTLRALSAALQRTDLGLPMVPPLQRQSFTSLVGKWAELADRAVATVLGESMPASAVIDTAADDANFEIKPVQPTVN